MEYRYERADVAEVYKILNNTDLVNKVKLFQMATYQFTRGHPLKVFNRCARLNIQFKSNRKLEMLSASIVTAPSIESFKSHLNNTGDNTLQTLLHPATRSTN